MSDIPIETVEMEPSESPLGSVIWLHGLGADGHDFEPIVPELGLGDSLPLRFVFPHAPTRAVTINGGMEMRAWFDVLGLDMLAEEDEKGIRESEALLRSLIEREEARGIAAEKIVLTGFSQGGAIALQCGLRHEKSLGGIIALSAYLPLRDTLEPERNPANSGTRIFMGHGQNDPMVPVSAATMAREQLEGLGYAVDWHDYPMEHSVCLEEIQAIGQWLRDRLS